jgi:hypothetical protein
MTLTQLKANKAELVAKLQVAKNPVTAINCPPAIRQQIIDANVKKYRRQITALQEQIDILQGRTKLIEKRQGFEPKLAEAFAS